MTENTSSPRSPVDHQRICAWARDVHGSLEDENNQQRRLSPRFPSDSTGSSRPPLPSLHVHQASSFEPHGPHPQIRTQGRYGPVQIVDSIDLTRDRLDTRRRRHLPHTAPADERGHPRRGDGHPPFQPQTSSSESSNSTLLSMGSFRRRRDSESDDDRVRPEAVTPSTARPLPQRPLPLPPRSHVSSPPAAYGTEESLSSQTHLLPRTEELFPPMHANSLPIPLPTTPVHREPATPWQSPASPVVAHRPIPSTYRSPHSSRPASSYGGPLSRTQHQRSPSPYALNPPSPSFYTPPSSPYATPISPSPISPSTYASLRSSPIPSPIPFAQPAPPSPPFQPGTIIITFNSASPSPIPVASTATRINDLSSYSYGTSALVGPRPLIRAQNSSPYIVVITPPR